MKLRPSITLKGYRHADLIRALQEVAESERGAFLADLAAEAITMRLHGGVGTRPAMLNLAAVGQTGTHALEQTSLPRSVAVHRPVDDEMQLDKAKIAVAFATPRLATK